MKPVTHIKDVYDILESCTVNRYIGTHKQDILTEPVKTIPKMQTFILKICGEYGFLAGGAVRHWLNKETGSPADYDVYAYKPEFRRNLVENFLDYGFEATHYNHNCVMLSDGAIQVQVIFSFVGNPIDIVDEFDFTVCRVATDGVNIYKDKDFDHNADKKLIRIKTVQCPISAVRRIVKYTKKGFWITNLQILKLYEDFFSKSDDYRAKIHELLEKQDASAGNLDKNDLGELYEMMKAVD